MSKTALGRLDQSVTVLARSTEDDTQGGRQADYAPWVTLPAAVVPVARGGRESSQARSVGSHVPYDVEIVYRPDITATMRLEWTPYLGSAKTLQILTVYPKDGRPDRLILECAEVA